MILPLQPPKAHRGSDRLDSKGKKMSPSLPSLRGTSWRKGPGSPSCQERLIEVLEVGGLGEQGLT